MANEKRNFRTNAVVNKVGESKVLSVLSVGVTYVSNAEGKIVSFNYADEQARNANMGAAPEIKTLESGRKVAKATVTFVNDEKQINFGEATPAPEFKSARGDSNINVNIVAWNGAAEDLARVAKVGGRISILNGVLTMETYTDKDGKTHVIPTITVNNYGQIGTNKVSKVDDGTTPSTTTATKEAEPATEEPEIPTEDDPFAGVDFGEM